MSIAHSSRRLACCALCVLVSACASTSAGPPSLVALSRERHPDFITPAEVRSANATSTLDMIRTLRPEFLRLSPRTADPLKVAGPAVYENQTYVGDVSWLSKIPLMEVTQVEYVHPAEARVRFGAMCPCEAGVLLVRTRPTYDPRYVVPASWDD
jgi:hypothetical protein